MGQAKKRKMLRSSSQDLHVSVSSVATESAASPDTAITDISAGALSDVEKTAQSKPSVSGVVSAILSHLHSRFKLDTNTPSGTELELRGITYEVFCRLKKKVEERNSYVVIPSNVRISYYEETQSLIFYVTNKQGHEAGAGFQYVIVDQMWADGTSLFWTEAMKEHGKHAIIPTGAITCETVDMTGKRISIEPDGSLTWARNRIPWLVIEVVDTQLYASAHDKVPLYLLGGPGATTFVMIINLTPARKSTKKANSTDEVIDSADESTDSTSASLEDPITHKDIGGITLRTSIPTSQPQEQSGEVYCYGKCEVSIFQLVATHEPTDDNPEFYKLSIKTVFEKRLIWPVPDPKAIEPWTFSWRDLQHGEELSEEQLGVPVTIHFRELNRLVENIRVGKPEYDATTNTVDKDGTVAVKNFGREVNKRAWDEWIPKKRRRTGSSVSTGPKNSQGDVEATK